MAQNGLEALTVLSRGRQPCSGTRGDRERQRGLAAEHVLQLRCLVHDLIHGNEDEVHEHQVHNGPQSADCCPSAEAHDGLLANRRVHYPHIAEALVQPAERTEHSPGSADVLTGHEHIRVGLHHLCEPFGESGSVGDAALSGIGSGGHDDAPVYAVE